MATDWQGAVAKTDPFMNEGGQNVNDMGPGQFFDFFFPWDYV